jgi:galactitol-specific phosphotransferase system IIB component
MNKKKILFICGSMNQTTMMHKISGHLEAHDCYFTPYYCNGFLKLITKMGALDFTVMGRKRAEQARNYLIENDLKIDYAGETNHYDLVVTGSDLIIQKNIKNKKIILVQEGITDREKWQYNVVKNLNLPRYLAGTSTAGLSDAYEKFCVASEGYKKLFISKGVNPEKIEVTGIPNYDNVQRHLENNFPHKHYVLIATSDARETFKIHNRKKFINYCKDIANGRQMIFKLHPNEKVDRAVQEIEEYAPGALVFSEGNTEHMIANCDVLITQYSTVTYLGLALGKEVHSYCLDVERLKQLTPIQNDGKSAENIAKICKEYL